MTHDLHVQREVTQTVLQLRDLYSVRREFERAGYNTDHVDAVITLYQTKYERITGRPYENRREVAEA